MQTYGRFPVAIDHGKGATLYDVAGREYIDFTAGIGVNSVGYANPKWVQAVADQAAKLGHISNLFYSQPYVQAGPAAVPPRGHVRRLFRQLRGRGQRGHDQAGPEVLL